MSENEEPEDGNVEAEPGAAGATDAERLAAEAAELRDRHLRLQAEFENYRKRRQREAEETRRAAKERILRELPAVVDNLERAVRHGQEGASRETLLEGVELVLKQVLEILARFGVEAVPALGEVFDPHRHEAMARVETSGDPPDGTVVEEYRRGYLLDGKILRPALVAVAKVPAEDDGDEDGGEESP